MSLATNDSTLTVTHGEDGTGPLVEAGVIGVTLTGQLANYTVDVGPTTRLAAAKHVDTSDGPDEAITWWHVEFGAADGSSTITMTTDDLPGLLGRLGALVAGVNEAHIDGGAR